MTKMYNSGQIKLESKDIILRLKVPEEDSSVPVKNSEAEYIFNFIISKGIQRSLETGLAYAKSASHIIAATGKMHIAIDPFQNDYQRLGLRNIESLGLMDYLDFREDYSHNVLPELVREGKYYEFIFIDGDHKFDGVLVDFYYADLLLQEKGYILLHDTWMRSTRLLMQFIKTNRRDYRKIPTRLRNLALYQKVGDDLRNGMYYREFYTMKSFLSSNLILWMTNGKKSFFKSILICLKKKLK